MERRRFMTLVSMGALTGSSCRRSPEGGTNRPALVIPTDGEVRTGGSRMIDIGDGHRVWTKKVGDAAVKLLLLHGGPGADHSYFECFEDFLPQNGIEFYYYDQLDSTNSDKPGDPKLWTIERFRDEVDAVRKGLNLDQFYLLGHSWGGILAIEYALAYPQHLKGLVLSNTTAAVLSPVKHVAELRAALPEDVRALVEKYEKAGQFDAPEYQKIMMEQVYTRHVCRLKPWPEPVERAFRNINARIYTYMFGPNEWVVTGTVKNWDRWADLPRIRTRSLLIGAKYDELPGEDIRKMAESIQNARAWISEKGSHFTMWDDQVPYFRELLGFLKSA